MQLDGGGVGPEQAEVADIADEDRAAGGDDVPGSVEDPQQVLGVGEVLHDGVEHDSVEGPVGPALEVGWFRRRSNSMPGSGRPSAAIWSRIRCKARGAKPGAAVALAVRCQPQQQQPGAAADL